jgi:hypothetical protein
MHISYESSLAGNVILTIFTSEPTLELFNYETAFLQFSLLGASLSNKMVRVLSIKCQGEVQ